MNKKIIKGGNFIEGMFTSFKKRNWWKTCKKQVKPYLKGFHQELEVSLAFRHFQLGKTQLEEFDSIMLPISSNSVVVFTTTRGVKKPQKEFNTLYFYEGVDWASIVGELAQRGVKKEKMLCKASKRIFYLYGASNHYVLKAYGDFPKRVVNLLNWQSQLGYGEWEVSSIHIYKYGKGKYSQYHNYKKYREFYISYLIEVAKMHEARGDADRLLAVMQEIKDIKGL